MKDKLAGWQTVGKANGFQVRMLLKSPKTKRGQWERIYVRVEPVKGGSAEITHSLAYPHRADVIFRRSAQVRP